MERRSTTSPCFFGYGSLVNGRTHDYPNARPASLTGWRRVWRHTTLRPRPFLTIEPCAGVSIDGLVAEVPNADWAALDAREAVYDRQPDVPIKLHTTARDQSVSTYVIPSLKYPAPDKLHPVLLSYLDVVVQGYWEVYGRDRAKNFFTTTVGWPRSVQNDRPDPIYPRAQVLSREQTTFVDDQLARLGCPVRD